MDSGWTQSGAGDARPVQAKLREIAKALRRTQFAAAGEGPKRGVNCEDDVVPNCAPSSANNAVSDQKTPSAIGKSPICDADLGANEDLMDKRSNVAEVDPKQNDNFGEAVDPNNVLSIAGGRAPSLA